jgi:hypothetical protein
MSGSFWLRAEGARFLLQFIKPTSDLVKRDFIRPMTNFFIVSRDKTPLLAEIF